MLKKRVKQKIKPYYLAIKSTCIYHIFNTLSNLLFRHNNLIIALLSAKLKGNKIVLGRNVALRFCRFEIHGSGNHVVIGDNCNLRGLRIYIRGGGNIQIGKNTKVNASKYQRTLFNPCNGGEIIIGEHCLFSNNIEIHTTDYHKIITDGTWTNVSENIVIGAHCWIGLQCLILKGTVIADNSIIGAKSLINKQFYESNVIIAGNPAKVIRRCVDWDF